MRTRKTQHPVRPHPQSPRETPILSDAARSLLASPDPTRRSKAQPPRMPSQQKLPDPLAGLLTPREAAELHRVTTRTLRNWRRAGVLELVRGPTGRIFYRLEDLLRLMKP